ncbi:uncharacterized protein LOC119085497 [Bradysia coprophila]|uniref:uncharacterized protein LOC119085497 n=1 Tax=Bradysia coprophila TaxID=38358 RepID=UPI00187DD485|nr:uncharacterized protein LOC119085497 [Bradysia coprophila]
MPSLAELEAFMTLAFFEKEFKYCVNTFNQSKTANGKLLFGMMEPHLQHYAIGCTRPLPTFLGHLDVHVELGPIYRMVVTETDTIVMYHLKTRPTIILPRGVISRLDQFVRESQQQVDSVQYVPGVGVEYEFDTAALFETTPEQLENRQLEAQLDDDDIQEYVYRTIMSIRAKNNPDREFTEVVRQLPDYEQEFIDFCNDFIVAMGDNSAEISKERIIKTVEAIIEDSFDPDRTRIALVAFCLWAFDPQTIQRILLMRKEGKSVKNAWTKDANTMPFKPRA